MKVTVTKCFDICYGHHLEGYDGACKNVHGHNSRIEVEFEKPDNYFAFEGMTVDFKEIKRIIKPIIYSLDHQNLNTIKAIGMPTAENIVRYLVKKIQDTIIGSGLIRLRMSETPDSFAEWKK